MVIKRWLDIVNHRPPIEDELHKNYTACVFTYMRKVLFTFTWYSPNWRNVTINNSCGFQFSVPLADHSQDF